MELAASPSGRGNLRTSLSESKSVRVRSSCSEVDMEVSALQFFFLSSLRHDRPFTVSMANAGKSWIADLIG